jgi:hypothetical protein
MFVCIFVKETFGWDVHPTSLEEFLSNWVGGESRRKDSLFLIGLGVGSWALWKVGYGFRKVQNKMVIEKEMLKSPNVIIFNILSVVH